MIKYSHAPLDFLCPFCLLVQGKENVESQLKSTDIVFQNADVTVFMATRKYPNNQGHVLIIPNGHFENIYDLPVGYFSKSPCFEQRCRFGDEIRISL